MRLFECLNVCVSTTISLTKFSRDLLLNTFIYCFHKKTQNVVFYFLFLFMYFAIHARETNQMCREKKVRRQPNQSIKLKQELINQRNVKKFIHM